MAKGRGSTNLTDGGGIASSRPCRAGKCTLAQAGDNSQSQLLLIIRLASHLVNTLAATQPVFTSQSAITDLTESCPREGAEKSLHLQDRREAQNISGKATGRESRCLCW